MFDGVGVKCGWNPALFSTYTEVWVNTSQLILAYKLNTDFFNFD